MQNRIQIKKPSDIMPLLKKWQRQKQENFMAITLDGAHRVIRVHHVTKGLVNKTIVHARESYWCAIKDLASAVMFVHNHPSGSTEPSIEDDTMTERLNLASMILGIKMLDHIIITPHGEWYSFREHDKILSEGYYADYQLRNFAESFAAEN